MWHIVIGKFQSNLSVNFCKCPSTVGKHLKENETIDQNLNFRHHMFTKGAVTWMIPVRRNETFQYYKLIISFKLYLTMLTRAITNQAVHVSI